MIVFINNSSFKVGKLLVNCLYMIILCFVMIISVLLAFNMLLYEYKYRYCRSFFINSPSLCSGV